MSGSSVKQTSGAFDRSSGPIYFASSSLETLLTGRVHNGLVAVDACMSDKAEQALVELMGQTDNVLLDSGVFGTCAAHARKTGTPLYKVFALPPAEVQGFAKLWDRYAYLVATYGDRLWGAIEIDMGGSDVKRETRARIESELGFTPIPVYHPLTDPYDYFDELASSYDRIAVGGVSSGGAKQRYQTVVRIYMRARAYPHLWVHALGVNRHPVLLAASPGSSDASVWIRNLRWKPHCSAVLLQDFDDLADELRYDYSDPTSRGMATVLAGAQTYFAQAVWDRWRHELAENELGGEALC